MNVVCCLLVSQTNPNSPGWMAKLTPSPIPTLHTNHPTARHTPGHPAQQTRLSPSLVPAKHVISQSAGFIKDFELLRLSLLSLKTYYLWTSLGRCSSDPD